MFLVAHIGTHTAYPVDRSTVRWARIGQPREYRESVFPRSLGARLSIEAGSPLGWERWVGDRGASIGLERFGASAPGEIVLSELGFNVENVVARAKSLL